MTDFNYIPPEEREAVLKKIVADPKAPGARELMNDEVQSEIYDATKGMSNAEKYEYLRKRLERERRNLIKVQKLHEHLLKCAAEVNAGSLLSPRKG